MRQKQEIYGQWMIDELARHGYRLSPGTLYPMLHAMERKGYLTSRKQREGRVGRKLYRATRLGKQGLALAKVAGSGIYRRSIEAPTAGNDGVPPHEHVMLPRAAQARFFAYFLSSV